jgi:hypothetical protein
LTRFSPEDYSGAMHPELKAYLVEQGSKVTASLIKVIVARSMKKPSAVEVRPVKKASAVAVEVQPEVAVETRPATAIPPVSPQKTPEAPKGTGCVPCTSDHLSTCSGALSEALRFARTRGFEDPEVQGRLALCVDELNIWERVDAAPEKIAALPAPEKEFLHRWLPRGRDLRHQVNEVGALQDLEGAAASAQQQSREARTEMRKLRPPVMSKIEALAGKVKAGEISNKEALGQLSEWWKKQRP